MLEVHKIASFSAPTFKPTKRSICQSQHAQPYLRLANFERIIYYKPVLTDADSLEMDDAESVWLLPEPTKPRKNLFV
jgi:hypothetical protein